MDRLAGGFGTARRLRATAAIGGAVALLAGVLLATAWPQLAAPARAPATQQLQLLAASFLGGREAWVVAKDSTAPNGATDLFRTLDGGRTWASLPVPLARSYASLLRFFDSGHGVLLLLRDEAAGRPRLFATETGGSGWRPLELPVEAGAATGLADFADPQAGWFLLPRTGGRSQLWRTRDGARSWQALEPPDLSGGRPALELIDPDHGLLAGGALWSTADGGDTWRLVAPDLPLAAGLGPDAAAGPEVRVPVTWPGGGAVLASHDAGATWSLAPLPGVPGLAGVGLASPADWYVAGAGTLTTTRDGGAAWTTFRPRLPAGAALGTLSLSPGEGWSLGTLATGASVLLRTTDGGRSWEAVPLPHVS